MSAVHKAGVSGALYSRPPVSWSVQYPKKETRWRQAVSGSRCSWHELSQHTDASPQQRAPLVSTHVFACCQVSMTSCNKQLTPGGGGRGVGGCVRCGAGSTIRAYFMPYNAASLRRVTEHVSMYVHHHLSQRPFLATRKNILCLDQDVHRWEFPYNCVVITIFLYRTWL